VFALARFVPRSEASMRASPLQRVIVSIQVIIDEEDSFGYISIGDLQDVLEDLIQLQGRGMEIQHSQSGRRGARMETPSSRRSSPLASSGKKRKASPYQVAYGKAFKKVAPNYKKKSGGWKKGGFAAAGRAARREPSVRRLKKK